MNRIQRLIDSYRFRGHLREVELDEAIEEGVALLQELDSLLLTIESDLDLPGYLHDRAAAIRKG